MKKRAAYFSMACLYKKPNAYGISLIASCLFFTTPPAIGQVRAIKSYQIPYSFSSRNECPEDSIHNYIMSLFKDKKLVNNIDEWEIISNAYYDNIIIKNNKTLERHNYEGSFLRKRNYYLDYNNVKTYIIYLSENETFFLTKLLSCNTSHTALFNKGCALSVIAIHSKNQSNALAISSQEQDLALQAFKSYIVPVIRRKLDTQ